MICLPAMTALPRTSAVEPSSPSAARATVLLPGAGFADESEGFAGIDVQ